MGENSFRLYMKTVSTYRCVRCNYVSNGKKEKKVEKVLKRYRNPHRLVGSSVRRVWDEENSHNYNVWSTLPVPTPTVYERSNVL